MAKAHSVSQLMNNGAPTGIAKGRVGHRRLGFCVHKPDITTVFIAGIRQKSMVGVGIGTAIAIDHMAVIADRDMPLAAGTSRPLGKPDVGDILDRLQAEPGLLPLVLANRSKPDSAEPSCIRAGRRDTKLVGHIGTTVTILVRPTRALSPELLGGVLRRLGRQSVVFDALTAFIALQEVLEVLEGSAGVGGK